jgi:hypothetical protein
MIVRSQPLAGKTKRERQSNGDIPKATKCDIVTTSCAIPAQPQIYRYRFLDPQGLTVSGVVGSSAYGSFYLQAINLSNWPALSGLYDQYRIVCARFTFLPRTNVVSGTAYNPPLYTIIDYDDISAITFRSQMTERVNCCVVPVYKSHQRTFKPHIDYATYSGAFTSYGNLAINGLMSLRPQYNTMD